MNKQKFESTEEQTEQVGMQLGDLICQVLTFCYSDANKRDLETDARTMPGHPTFEQYVSAALSHRISELFEVRRKHPPATKND